MFDTQTTEKLALYLGYSESQYIFEQKLQFKDLTTTTKNAVLNILNRIDELDQKAIEAIGERNTVNNIKKVEDIEFFEGAGAGNESETYLYYASQQVELLSKLLGIPLLYNIYSFGTSYIAAIQIR